MSKIPGVPEQVVTSAKLAQIIQLVKDNQLATAALIFIAWQLGVIADATSYVGGMC
jgi:hypothetical protein